MNINEIKVLKIQRINEELVLWKDKENIQLSSQFTKRANENTHINAIRNENSEISMENPQLQRIISNCFKNIYSNNLENLEEMDQFLDTHELPKPNQVDF